MLDALAAGGHEPRGFDRVPARHRAPGTYPTVVGDVTDRSAVRNAVHGCDAVIHLAAVADVNEVVVNPVVADTVNVHGTLQVLEAVRREEVARVVYGSTIWVYAGGPHEEPDEESPLAPPSHVYTATKLAGEHYTNAYAQLYGVSQTILRFGIPYGPRARPAAVVPSFVGRAQRREALHIAGDGRQTRQFVYVEDLAAGIVAGLQQAAAGRTFNLVGDEVTSVREIADAVCEVVARVPIVHSHERPGDVRFGRVSGRRAADELGWQAATPFADGLRRYVDWLAVTSDSPPAAAASSTSGSAAVVPFQEPTEL